MPGICPAMLQLYPNILHYKNKVLLELRHSMKLPCDECGSWLMGSYLGTVRGLRLDFRLLFK